MLWSEQGEAVAREGFAAARKRTDAIDADLRAWANEAFSGDDRGVLLVGTGGYGRRTLLPASDLDLVVFVGDSNARAEEIERFLQGLWDRGRTVGHVVHTESDLKAAAKQSFESRTALFDARLLWGDAALAGRFEAVAYAVLDDEPKAFARHLAARRWDRLLRHGPTTDMAEPHLQSGRGGLRDVQLASWIANLAPDASGEVEAARKTAEGILLAFRGALHEVAGRGEERLRLEVQPEVAERLGYDDTVAAMRDLLAAMTWSDRILSERLDALYRRRARRRRLDDLATAWRTFAEDDAAGAVLTNALRLRLARQAPGAAAPEDPPSVVRSALARPRLARRIMDLAHNELLAHLVPHWRHVEGLVRPDPVHRYGVARHSLRSVVHLDRLLRTAERKGWEVAAAASESPRRDLLLLSALLHDAGKGLGGDHVEIGAHLVPELVAPLGLEAEEVDFVRFVVGAHLLLPRSAFRRDIDDPSLIESLAEWVGSKERLAALYLLALADLAATARGALDDWRRSLLTTLYVRLRRQIERRLPPEEIVESTRRRRIAQIRSRTAAVSEAQLRAHFSSLPPRYALAFTGEQILHHIDLVERLGDGVLLADRVRGPQKGTTEVTVLGRARRGLVSGVTGLFAALGLNILQAEVMSRNDGLALDAFIVEDPDGRLLHDSEWMRFVRLLDTCVLGGEPIEPHIERQARYEGRPRAGSRVEIIPDASPSAAVLEVRAPDRIGLLYEITREIYRCGFGLTSAIVATEEAIAIDIFYIVHPSGRPPTPEEAERLRSALASAL